MSVKRQATTDLNHDNWDQEDEREEMGTYKMASKDELEKRVIKTAKRRSQINTGDDSKKSVFSGFGGFNKAKPSSFEFLANLTNGNKTNGTPAVKNDNAVSSSIFNASGSNSGGLFSIPVSTPPSTKTGSTFGSPIAASTAVFGVSSPQTNTTSSLFTASKADSTVKDSTINKATSSSGTEAGGFTIKATTNVSTSQVSSTIFGTPTTTTSKSPFSIKTNTSSSPLKIQPVTSTTSSSLFTNSQQKSNEKKDENPNKMKFYAKLKGLNESVSDWIKKHVEETPLCILSPIFNDYEKYLKEIKDEYEKSEPKEEEIKPAEPKKEETKPSFSFGIKPPAPESTPATTVTKPATTALPAVTGGFFGINKASSTGTADENKPTPFTFASNTSPNAANENKPTPFTFSSNPTAGSSPAPAPFSFGIGQKFSFSPNTQKPEANDEKKNENEDEDEPPKVEFTPVVEENSVYDKRCKVFVKKDGNFIDNGVGTLYIKKIEGSEKHQLIVRANTSLGNVLVNLVLASAIPTQRMGKNNVMMVCIPTPESKPPPTPILIRVKTGEEADDLLETLDKYKA